jgi:hypothetical protein
MNDVQRENFSVGRVEISAITEKESWKCIRDTLVDLRQWYGSKHSSEAVERRPSSPVAELIDRVHSAALEIICAAQASLPNIGS